ncbi:hypothetical protein PENTCL1PPCAC_14336, partial [Pristionchus entomophagus]
AGILSNLLLLYIIKRFSSSDLGTYRHLLTVFSAHDIFLTVLHAILRPKNIIIGTVFSLVADGPIESKHFSSIYSACFAVPFSLMCFHFVYRYWAIERYLLVLHGTTGHFEDDALREVRQAFFETYGKRIEQGWVILDHWVS